MALPSSGPISLGQVRTELKLSSTINLGQKEVRDLAKISSGKISLNDLRGKSSELQPQDCDYYFETLEDFKARRKEIIAENNNDLSQKTFGFGDSVTILEGAFFHTPIISTPKAIYGNNITSFDWCFLGCTSLTTIPESLFDNCSNVTDFGECFSGCSSLTTIPESLFDNCSNVTNFDYCFYACISLTAIPEGLFDNCSNATNFGSCFDNCSSLTTIPVGLFDNCPNITDIRYCFDNCKSLTSIPEGLFDNCPNVIYFSYCFRNCKSLTTISEGLFDNCSNVNNFGYCFDGCLEITSSLPDAWNKEKFPNVTSYKYYARDCTKAANYADIPEDWK